MRRQMLIFVATMLVTVSTLAQTLNVRGTVIPLQMAVKIISIMYLVPKLLT